MKLVQLGESSRHLNLECDGKVIPHIELERYAPNTIYLRLGHNLQYGPFTEQQVINMTQLIADCLSFGAGQPIEGIPDSIKRGISLVEK